MPIPARHSTTAPLVLEPHLPPFVALPVFDGEKNLTGWRVIDQRERVVVSGLHACEAGQLAEALTRRSGGQA